MSSHVTFDFSRPATLAHSLGAAAVFDATSEIGRASGSLGAANAVTRLWAGRLGTWANGIDYTVLPRLGASARVEYDYGKPQVRARASAAGNSGDLAQAFNANPHDPRVNRVIAGRGDLAENMRIGKEPWSFRMDTGAGDGSDPAATGTIALSGGLDPNDAKPNQYDFESDAAGGLFVFDAADPLKLVQFMALLDASVAWTLTLRYLRDTSVGIPIATSTSQVVRVDLPVVILPGWGIGFTAATQGSAFCTVARY